MPMLPTPFLTDRAAVGEADALIAQYGDEAGFAAAARAEDYRLRGNHIHFARWRQIEQWVVYLSITEPLGTVH